MNVLKCDNMHFLWWDPVTNEINSTDVGLTSAVLDEPVVFFLMSKIVFSVFFSGSFSLV